MILQCSIFLFVLKCCSSSSTLVYKENVNVTYNREWVNLGGLFPVSWNENGKCGFLSTTAVEQVEAMVFAIKEINKDPFLLPNVSLTFDIRDTCAIPSRALEIALNYVHTSGNQDTIAVSAVIGSAFTDSSILVANILGLFETPQISYESTGAVLSDKTRYGYFFRTIPSDILQVKAIASLIQEFEWNYIFVFYSEDTYGEDGAMSLVEEFQARNSTLGVCIALQMGLPIAAEDDHVFELAIEQMNREWVRNASVAIIFGHNDQANGLFRALERKLETNPNSPLQDITWIGSDSWGKNFDSTFYPIARGMFAIQPLPAVIPAFVDYFVGLRPNTTLNPWFDGYWESVFNCSLKTSRNPCRLDKQMLERNLTLNSQYPNVIRAVFAIANALNRMIENNCHDNTLCDNVTVTQVNNDQNSVVNGQLLRKYLFNTTLADIGHFNGEDHVFDENGDVTSSYVIFNLQEDSTNKFRFYPVGSWNHINLLNISVANIQWRSGKKVPQSVCSLQCGLGQEPVGVPNQAQCCWTCRKCLGEFSVSSGDRCYECNNTYIPNSDNSKCTALPITYLTWSSPLGITTAFLASIGIVVSVGCGIMFLVFIRNPVIKASSRELSAVLLCGILLCYIVPLIYLAKPSPGSCGVQRLISGLCFALIYSALLVKTNRIHRIFNRSKEASLSPRFVSPASQVMFTLLLSLIQLIIASIWLAIEPPRETTDLVNRRLLELVCDHSPHATLIVTVVYNIFLLILCAFFAFRTRKVPELFNEAKFISITVFSLCILWLAFVPTFYISTTVNSGSEFQIFSLLLTIMLSATTTLCCLLMPKLFLVLFMNVKGKLNVTTTSMTSSELRSK